MILALVGFGVVIILGTFVVCLWSAATGGTLAGRAIKNRKSTQVLTVNNKVVDAPNKPIKYFMKLGNRKVEIASSEVADVKRRGYEVLKE